MAGTVDQLQIMVDGTFAVPVRPTTYVNSRTLAADTAEAVTVPAGAKYVIFGGDVSFAVRYNASGVGTAAAFGDVTDGSGCEINPTIRYLFGVAEISVITHATGGGNVSMTFFS